MEAGCTKLGAGCEGRSFNLSLPPQRQIENPVLKGAAQVLDRIERGTQHIRQFPLPYGHRPLFQSWLAPDLDIHYEFFGKFFGYPVVRLQKGWVYFHSDEGSYLETVNPVIWRDGKIESGLLRIHGRIGLTMNEQFNRGKMPLWLALGTVRFENGRVYATAKTFVDERPSYPRFADEEPTIDFDRLLLHYKFGCTNSRGEYDVTPALEEFFRSYFEEPAPPGPFVTGLKGSRLLELAERVRQQRNPPPPGTDFPHWPSWRETVEAVQEFDFRNPLFADPVSGETLFVKSLENLIESSRPTSLPPLPAASLRLRGIRYENRSRGWSSELDQIEFIIPQDLVWHDPENFSGSMEIRLGRLIHNGLLQEGLVVESPEKIIFKFQGGPDGIQVVQNSGQLSIHSFQDELSARLASILLNLFYDYRSRNLSLKGDFNFDGKAGQAIRLLPQSALQGEWSSRCGFQSEDLLAVSGLISCRGNLRDFSLERLGSEGVPSLTVNLDRAFFRGAQLYYSGQSDSIRFKLKELEGKSGFRFKTPRGARGGFETRLLVSRLEGAVLPSGKIHMESSHPISSAPFAALEGEGVLQRPDGVTIPIKQGIINLYSVDYSPIDHRWRSRGLLQAEYENRPADYLKADRDQVLSWSGEPQKIRTTLSLHDWEIDSEGALIFQEGELVSHSVDRSEGVSPSLFPQQVASLPTVLPPSLQIETKREASKESPLLPALRQILGSFAASIDQINRLQIDLPQNPAEPEIPLWGDSVTVSLRFPQKISWKMEMGTWPDRRTGKEKIAFFSLGPERPVRACLNLFGRCITQEEVVFEGIKLHTEDLPPEQFDWTGFQWSEPQGYQSGELVLQLSHGSGFVNLVELLFESQGLNPASFGVKQDNTSWRLPLDWDQIRKLIGTILVRSGDSGVSGDSRATGSSAMIRRPPSFLWNEMTGIVDLQFQEGPREFHLEGAGKVRTDLLFEVDSKVPLRIWRNEGDGKIGADPFRLSHLRFSASPLLLDLKDFQIGGRSKLVIDPGRQKLHAPYHLGSLQFRFRPSEKFPTWEGLVTSLVGRNLTFNRGNEMDQLDPMQRRFETSTIGSDRLRFEFSLKKVCEESAAHCKSARFEGSPHIGRNFSLKQFPHRLEIGFGELEDRQMSFVGEHFVIPRLHYRANRGGMISVPLGSGGIFDQDFYLSLSDLTLSAGGEMELERGLTLRLREASYARGVNIQTRKDEIQFSSDQVHLAFDKMTLDFLKNLGLPGLDVTLSSVDFDGPLAQSTVRNRDVDLQGRMRFSSKGHLTFHHHHPSIDIDHLESDFSLDMDALRRLQTTEGDLSLLEFEGLTLKVEDLHAQLALLGIFETHLAHRLGHHHPHFEGDLRVREGRIRIQKVPGRPTPSVSVELNGISLHQNGTSHETMVQLGGAGSGVGLEFPDIRFDMSGQGAVVLTNEGGIWKRRITLGPSELSLLFQGGRIKRK